MRFGLEVRKQVTTRMRRPAQMEVAAAAMKSASRVPAHAALPPPWQHARTCARLTRRASHWNSKEPNAFYPLPATKWVVKQVCPPLASLLTLHV